MSFPGWAKGPTRRQVAIGLGWTLILTTLLAMGIGCGFHLPGFGRGSQSNQSFRFGAEETPRLLRTARYYKLMGRSEEALKELAEAHRLAPSNLKVANTLAQLYDELGMGPQAQQIYQEALLLDPSNPVLLNNLGFSYYLGANWSQAEKYFRHALACQPTYQSARNNLGLLLCRRGHRQEARQLWQEAEGEAATQKMAQALAVLGLADEPLYAKNPGPSSGNQDNRAPASLERHLATDSVTAAKPAGNLPDPEKVVKASVEPAISSAMTLPVQAPAKLVARPLKSQGLESPCPKAPAFLPGDKRMAAAAPLTHPAASGLSTREGSPRPVPARIAQAEVPSQSVPAPKIVTPEKSRQETPQLVQAMRPVLQRSNPGSLRENPTTARLTYLTTAELAETNIAILNGNGLHDLAHVTRSRLSLEGFSVAAIGNFRDFGVDRTVIYYRPDAKQVAMALNNKFFPMADVELSPQLAGNVDIKVVLGRDQLPQQRADASQPETKKSL